LLSPEEEALQVTQLQDSLREMQALAKQRKEEEDFMAAAQARTRRKAVQLPRGGQHLVPPDDNRKLHPSGSFKGKA